MWQEVDGKGQNSHSWHDVDSRSFPAMSIVVVVLVLSVLVLLVAALAVVVRHDGYGTLPPPRSHPSWDDGAPLSGGGLAGRGLTSRGLV